MAENTLSISASENLNDASTEFRCPVIRIGSTEKHPNADNLSITHVTGYTVIFRTGDFHTGDLAVYIPVDCLVPTSRPEFQFLVSGGKERHRVKARRLRGVFSMGLLIPAGDGLSVGDDAITFYDIERYVSPEEQRLHKINTQVRKSQRGFKLPVYGLEALRKAPNAISEGTLVWVSEKAHGCNARYSYTRGRFWVGSHKSMRGCSRHRMAEWFTSLKLRVWDFFGKQHRAHLLRDRGDVWWEIAEQYNLKEILKAYPDLVLYGEIYGEGVQKFTYDSPKGRKLLIFDVFDLKTKEYYSVNQFFDFARKTGLPMVPTLALTAWHPSLVSFADGPTTIGGAHIREGMVVKTLEGPRVALKYASEAYLLKAE